MTWIDPGTLDQGEWSWKNIKYVEYTLLTPQEQSSERNLPGTIIPWRDIFDNDVNYIM